MKREKIKTENIYQKAEKEEVKGRLTKEHERNRHFLTQEPK